MSGPTEIPVPSGHPDRDLLADLAAEVLSADLARQVHQHVMSCSDCANLLAQAEGIRSMLRQSRPEPMPPEVWNRLEQALVTARREGRAGDEFQSLIPARGADETAETRALTRLPIGSDARADSGRRIVRSGAGPATGAMAASGGPKTGRLSRMSQGPRGRQGARRQAIEELKADRPSRLSRLMPALRIAAAVLVVVGAGGLVLQLRGNGGGAADSTASASGSAASVPILAPVQSTRTDYTKAALNRQVKTLIATSEKLQSTSRTELAPDSAADGRASKSAASSAAPSASAFSAQGGQQLLRSPAALQACLSAIGAAQVQPVAVDLATYAGQEAAIIVLPADGDGYDVWVVTRDCSAANDGGTIDFVTINP